MNGKIGLILVILIGCCFSSVAQKDQIYKSLDEALKNPDEVYALYLDYNRHLSYSETFSSFKNLEDLYLHSFPNIPTEIGELTQLRKLKIWYGNHAEIPPFIYDMHQLEYLQIRFNQLETISPKIAALSHLKVLDLSSNKLKSIPDEVGKLTALEELELGGNLLKEVPESIGYLKKIQVLGLCGNALKSLPVSITKWTKWVAVSLCENNFRKTPDFPRNFKGSLNLDHNKISYRQRKKDLLKYRDSNFKLIFDSYLADGDHNGKLKHHAAIGQFKSYEDEAFTLSPHDYAKFKNLHTLTISNFERNSFPPEFYELVQLEKLVLKGGNRSKLRFQKNLEDFHILKQLSVYKFDLSETGMLNPIFIIKNLESLSLSDNFITHIPPEIGQLINLTHLNLSKNKITRLPDSIAYLTQLETLDLNKNPMPKSEIDRIQKLLPNTEIYF